MKLRARTVQAEDVTLCQGRRQLNSPRSVATCLNYGIDPQTLVHKPLAVFQEQSESDELALMCYNHHEKKRQEQLKSLMRRRSSMGTTVTDEKKLLAWRTPKKVQASSAGSTALAKEQQRLEEQMRRQERVRQKTDFI